MSIYQIEQAPAPTHKASGITKTEWFEKVMTPSEVLRAAGDRVSVTDCTGFTSGTVSIAAASGTATYKLVLYGA